MENLETEVNVKNKIMPRLGLVHVFLFWVAVGQIVAYLISNGLLLGIESYFYEYIGSFIPSVSRMDKVLFFDNVVAKRYASIFFFLMPFLFIVLLFFNVETSVAEVRSNKKETFVAWVFGAVGCVVFISGLNIPGPAAIFHSSIYGLAFLVNTLTFLSVYCFRIVFCIVFNK